MRIAWGRKVSPMFRTRLLEVCQELGWTFGHASWLMACIAFETAETFSPSIQNAAGSGATGLIQFMPKTAQGLGTSVEQLTLMNQEEQLEYVKAYFKPYAYRIKSLSDMYMAILMPKYIGKSDQDVLFADPGVAYRQNSGLDTNRDGKVTKAEASAKVKAKHEKGMLDLYRYDYQV